MCGRFWLVFQVSATKLQRYLLQFVPPCETDKESEEEQGCTPRLVNVMSII